MTTTPTQLDPLETVPDPDTVRLLLADAIRRSDLLRYLLRVAVRKANYPPPTPRSGTSTAERQGVARA